MKSYSLIILATHCFILFGKAQPVVVLENSGGKLPLEKEIKIGGCPGREIRIEQLSQIAGMIQRTFWVKVRMSMIQVFYDPENQRNASLHRFLESFQKKTKSYSDLTDFSRS